MSPLPAMRDLAQFKPGWAFWLGLGCAILAGLWI